MTLRQRQLFITRCAQLLPFSVRHARSAAPPPFKTLEFTLFNVAKSVSVQFQELHSTEPWFHAHLKEGRQMAERLIYEYCAETGGREGTFLVRPSDRCLLSYTLSFW